MLPLTVGSLFSGIGGLDLGLERAGWAVQWQVESDEFCTRVLARHWPCVPRHGDILAVDPERLAPVTLVCGGFPCQPVSVAGRRRGQDDTRWLWSEFARIIRVLRPPLVLVENVPGLLGRGLGEVLGDLAASGYDAEWDGVPARSVGAPHIRDRVFIVAYADRLRWGADFPLVLSRQPHLTRGGGQLADADRARLEGRQPQPQCPGEWFARAGRMADSYRQCGALRATKGQQPWRSASGGPDVADPNGLRQLQPPGSKPDQRERWGRSGDPDWWAVEPPVGRMAHGVPARVDRLRALGNAVVPQVAEWIGWRLRALAEAA